MMVYSLYSQPTVCINGCRNQGVISDMCRQDFKNDIKMYYCLSAMRNSNIIIMTIWVKTVIHHRLINSAIQ
jgi:hypothetical protein